MPTSRPDGPLRRNSAEFVDGLDIDILDQADDSSPIELATGERKTGLGEFDRISRIIEQFQRRAARDSESFSGTTNPICWCCTKFTIPPTAVVSTWRSRKRRAIDKVDLEKIESVGLAGCTP
jgi:hypothetical protein